MNKYYILLLFMYSCLPLKNIQKLSNKEEIRLIELNEHMQNIVMLGLEEVNNINCKMKSERVSDFYVFNRSCQFQNCDYTLTRHSSFSYYKKFHPHFNLMEATLINGIIILIKSNVISDKEKKIVKNIDYEYNYLFDIKNDVEFFNSDETIIRIHYKMINNHIIVKKSDCNYLFK